MFIPISKRAYIKKHLKNNPQENKKELEKVLKCALADFKKGIKCSCGSDIWVIGSAFVGNKCFTCITGEAMPDDDYELNEALPKKPYKRLDFIDRIFTDFPD